MSYAKKGLCQCPVVMGVLGAAWKLLRVGIERSSPFVWLIFGRWHDPAPAGGATRSEANMYPSGRLMAESACNRPFSGGVRAGRLSGATSEQRLKAVRGPWPTGLRSYRREESLSITPVASVIADLYRQPHTHGGQPCPCCRLCAGQDSENRPVRSA